MSPAPISFTVKVTDAEVPTAQTATAALSITISAAPLSVVTTSLPTAVDGSAYSATLQAAGGVSPYTWAVTTGSLPAGLTLNGSTGRNFGHTDEFGQYIYRHGDRLGDANTTDSVEATDDHGESATVDQYHEPGCWGCWHDLQPVLGGADRRHHSLFLGRHERELTVRTLGNSTTGAITGTPTGPQTGPINFTVTVTDSESPVSKTASAALSISISAPTLTITTTTLGSGVLGQAYNATLGATGGVQPYTWSIISGSLPAGLGLNSNGQITGTPTATGTSNFTVKVVDSETPTAQSATAGLSISINNSAPLQITTSGLPTGVINTLYSNAFLSASGGIQPYTWSIVSGSLPPGLTLTPSTGQISGTPTSQGTFNFTAKVTDSSNPNQSATASLSITINGTLTITTTGLPNGVNGSSYSATVNASGGLQPYGWSITSGSLPTGLNLNSSSGQISGTPTANGTFSFTVTVTDSENPQASAQANLSISINTGSPLQINTGGLPEGSEVTPSSVTLYASGGVQPYSWSIASGSLPGGLTLGASSGIISKFSTATGTFNFTVKVTDSASETATTQLSILVITCNSNSALSGNWAALLEGFNNNQQPAPYVAEVGSFVADGAGNITSGSLDTNDQVNGPSSGSITTGKYCIATNNTGLITWTQDVGGTSASHTFAIAVNTSNTNGRRALSITKTRHL